MLKKVQVYWSFCYSYSLAVSVMCDVMPGYACFVRVVMRFMNLFLHRYAYMLCNVSLNTPIACSVCFLGMTSSFAIVNKSLSCAFSKIS